jgi:hypothetical protein
MSLSTKIYVEAMDCPSEEAMIRMALQSFRNIHSLQADFSGRMLHLVHDEDIDSIMKAIIALNLGARHGILKSILELLKSTNTKSRH